MESCGVVFAQFLVRMKIRQKYEFAFRMYSSIAEVKVLGGKTSNMAGIFSIWVQDKALIIHANLFRPFRPGYLPKFALGGLFCSR